MNWRKTKKGTRLTVHYGSYLPPLITPGKGHGDYSHTNSIFILLLNDPNTSFSKL